MLNVGLYGVIEAKYLCFIVCICELLFVNECQLVTSIL